MQRTILFLRTLVYSSPDLRVASMIAMTLDRRSSSLLLNVYRWADLGFRTMFRYAKSVSRSWRPRGSVVIRPGGIGLPWDLPDRIHSSILRVLSSQASPRASTTSMRPRFLVSTTFILLQLSVSTQSSVRPGARSILLYLVYAAYIRHVEKWVRCAVKTVIDAWVLVTYVSLYLQNSRAAATLAMTNTRSPAELVQAIGMRRDPFSLSLLVARRILFAYAFVTCCTQCTHHTDATC